MTTVFKTFDKDINDAWQPVPPSWSVDIELQRQYEYYKVLNGLYGNPGRAHVIEVWASGPDGGSIMAYVFDFNSRDDSFRCMLLEQAESEFNYKRTTVQP